LAAGSRPLGPGHLLAAAEVAHEDGPWERPDDFRKENVVLRYTAWNENGRFSLMSTAYHGTWNATDQIPRRALDRGLLSRFGSLDRSDGGRSQRYTLQGDWEREQESVLDKISAYAFYYDLNLFSNFTFFLDDPVHGDQFEQEDKRFVSGVQASREWSHALRDVEMSEKIGLQARNDVIRNGLFHTENRVRLSTTREDNIIETSASPYWENRTHWREKLRSVAGLRWDYFNFHVRSDNPANSGSRGVWLVSPKAGLVFGPWVYTEYFVNVGQGFHSNDARGVTTTIDPKSGAPVSPVTPLVPVKGAEVGARTWAVAHLQSSLALWILDSASELVFSGDAGTTEPNRASRRYGVEWRNEFTPSRSLRLDATVALSHARFTEDDTAGNFIPGSLETMASAGIAVHDLDGWGGEVRLRYFGPRPLIEDNSVRSKASALVNMRVERTLTSNVTLAVDVLNAFDEAANDIEYFYASRLANEPPGASTDDVHLHPAEPRQFRVSLIARF